MAVTHHPFFQDLSGSFGDYFTVKKYKNKTVVCRRIGKRTKDASDLQSQNETIFKMANNMAKSVYRDLVKREEARLRLKLPAGIELYNALVKEFHAETKAKERK